MSLLSTRRCRVNSMSHTLKTVVQVGKKTSFIGTFTVKCCCKTAKDKSSVQHDVLCKESQFKHSSSEPFQLY